MLQSTNFFSLLLLCDDFVSCLVVFFFLLRYGEFEGDTSSFHLCMLRSLINRKSANLHRQCHGKSSTNVYFSSLISSQIVLFEHRFSLFSLSCVCFDTAKVQTYISHALMRFLVMRVWSSLEFHTQHVVTFIIPRDFGSEIFSPAIWDLARMHPEGMYVREICWADFKNPTKHENSLSLAVESVRLTLTDFLYI